jgi:hypothetical protein
LAPLMKITFSHIPTPHASGCPPPPHRGGCGLDIPIYVEAHTPGKKHSYIYVCSYTYKKEY